MHGTIGIKELKTTAAVAPDPALPTFKPRWWFKHDRLDARPVAWSLWHHPEEWEWGSTGRYRIMHKPSKHEFWVASGYGNYHLIDADCGCSSAGGHFQRFQQRIFHRAFMQWVSRSIDHEHFADHFIH